jgi:hypothetical protein
MKDDNPAGRGAFMIDRKPLKPGANGARRADKAVRPTLGAGFGCAPALAALPAVQERCKVGVQEPPYGEFRLTVQNPVWYVWRGSTFRAA